MKSKLHLVMPYINLISSLPGSCALQRERAAAVTHMDLIQHINMELQFQLLMYYRDVAIGTFPFLLHIKNSSEEKK